MSWLQWTIGDRLSKTESSVSSLCSGSFNGSQQYSWDEKETEMVKIMCDGNNEQINTII